MKAFFKFLGWTVFVLVVLVAVLLFAFGPIAKFAVNHVAGPFLGVSAHVDDVSFSPVKGKLTMENFVLGNPEGFESEYMMTSCCCGKNGKFSPSLLPVWSAACWETS